MINFAMLMDLHWGAISPERMEQEMNETFFKFIEHNDTDVVIIGGDLFDSKQYLTSEVTKHVIRFINKLITKVDLIIFLTGTKTHDDLQLDTLKEIYNNIYFMNEYNCAKTIFISNVSILNIYKHDGIVRANIIDTLHFKEEYHYSYTSDEEMTVLCIPEEYMLEQDEYYNAYFDDITYDFIIYHGMVDKIWYAQKNKENQNELTKHSSAPVFKVDYLLEHCQYCYAGHVHMHKRYGQDKRFLYVGPYTRWEFGKDDNVGFQYVYYDTERKLSTERFIVNENAQIMTTRVLNINETISLTDLNTKLNEIIQYEMNRADKMRFIINIKSSIENYLGIKDFVISKIGEIKFIKLILSVDIDDEFIESTKETIETQKIEQRKYLYENISMEERIQRFLKNKKNIDLSVEDIKKVLNMEVK